MMPVVSSSITHGDWRGWEEDLNKSKRMKQLADEGHWLIDNLDPDRRDFVVHLVPAVPRFVLLHLLEITTWAVFYVWRDAMADLPSSLYFSAVTYTTTGYGDLVLPKEWQLVGAIEALTGILMCGWSTGFFFAVFSRMLPAEARR